MRKLLLSSFLAFLCLFISDTANSQVLIQEGFETATFPPTGWTGINNSSSGGNDWKLSPTATFTDGPYAANTGTNCMVYEYKSTSAGDAWMISPVLALTSGSNYLITFSYRIRSATYPEKMKVTIGNAATVAGQTTTLWDNNGGSS